MKKLNNFTLSIFIAQYVNNKTKLLVICVLCIFPIHLYSQNNEDFPSFKHHEIRLGIDDPFVNMILDDGGSPSHKNRHYTYTGRIFLEYQYHFNKWISVGANLGWSGAFSEGYSPTNPSVRSNYMQYSLMPKVQCTYFHSKWVELYAAGAIGALYETTNASSKYKTLWYGTTQITLFGLAVGNGQWFGAFEIAPAFYFGNCYGLASSTMSLFNISVSYHF